MVNYMGFLGLVKSKVVYNLVLNKKTARTRSGGSLRITWWHVLTAMFSLSRTIAEAHECGKYMNHGN
jgi:hypothetical protein